ncbi:hypothetical protein Pan189_19940 [Stratiformator vulcanicus]|uniref:Uncharacterized protein n=1 Tax=Stratiformator vulcanicus TaxID=2527980 RepID=A0A517R1A4_9PLAN|nr:hypothetical protein Pan189_19940 [Stratiformator vulcanicus]
MLTVFRVFYVSAFVCVTTGSAIVLIELPDDVIKAVCVSLASVIAGAFFSGVMLQSWRIPFLAALFVANAAAGIAAELISEGWDWLPIALSGASAVVCLLFLSSPVAVGSDWVSAILSSRQVRAEEDEG